MTIALKSLSRFGFFLLLVNSSDILVAQTTISATETYKSRVQYSTLFPRREPRLSDTEIRRRVRKEHKQLPSSEERDYTKKTECKKGEFVDSGYVASILSYDQSGNGIVTITEFVSESENSIYTKSSNSNVVLSTAYSFSLSGDEIELPSDHDPSLVVSERRLIASSPAMTIFRFEEYFKRAEHEDRELEDMLEKILDYRLSTIWIKQVAEVTDTLESQENEKITRKFFASGVKHHLRRQEWYIIRIEVALQDQAVQSVLFSISMNGESSIDPKIQLPNTKILAQGDMSLEFRRR